MNGWTNLKKAEADCNCGFRKLASMTCYAYETYLFNKKL